MDNKKVLEQFFSDDYATFCNFLIEGINGACRIYIHFYSSYINPDSRLISHYLPSMYSSEEASDKRLCTSLFSESEVSLCPDLLLDVPATQEDVVA